MMKKSEVYEKAAKEMSERGMHHGDYVDPDGGRAVCLFGACFLAMGREVEEFDLDGVPLHYISYGNGEAYSEDCLTELIAAIGGDNPSDVVDYNDNESTSQEDAILALKRAAETAKEVEDDAVVDEQGETENGQQTA